MDPFPTLKKSQIVVFESITHAAIEPRRGIVSIDLSGPPFMPNRVRVGIERGRLPALVMTLLYLGGLLAKGHSGGVAMPKVGETASLSLEMGKLSATTAVSTKHVSMTIEVGELPLSGQLLPATAREFASALLRAADAVDGGHALH